MRASERSISANATALLVCWMFNQDLLHVLLNAVIGSTPASLLLWGGYFMLYVIAWRNTPGILAKRDIVLFSGWVFLLAFSVFMLSKEQSEYMMLTAKSVVKCSLAYFIGKMIALDKSKNFMSMLALSNIVAAAAFLFLFRMMMSSGARELMYGESSRIAGAAGEYSQFLGYSMLPQVCTAVFLAFNGWMSQIPLMILFLYGILLSGARGPLVCAFAAGLLTLLKIINLRSWKSWLMIIIISISVGMVIANYLEILRWLLKVFRNINLSTRTIETMINGTFTQSSGRTSFYKAALKGIDEYFFTGTGIFRDRQYLWTNVKLEHYNGIPINQSVGSYSHNIVLDFLLQFGVFAGGCILVYIAGMMLRAYKACAKKFARVGGNALFMYIVLLSIGLLPLFISGTWVHDTNFYLMLGFVLEQLRHTTKKKRSLK